jgi:hypothetical protein
MPVGRQNANTDNPPGIGIGMTLQNTMISVQFELKSRPWLISAGTGMVVFLGFAGRIIGISLATSVFENMIQKNLHRGVPDLPDALVRSVVADATAVWNVIPEVSQVFSSQIPIRYYCPHHRCPAWFSI